MFPQEDIISKSGKLVPSVESKKYPNCQNRITGHTDRSTRHRKVQSLMPEAKEFKAKNDDFYFTRKIIQGANRDVLKAYKAYKRECTLSGRNKGMTSELLTI